jgi:hypothetical protein
VHFDAKGSKQELIKFFNEIPEAYQIVMDPTLSEEGK